MNYRTDDPKAELFGKIKDHLGVVLNTQLDIEQVKLPYANKLEMLNELTGNGIAQLPEVSILMIGGSDSVGSSTLLLYTCISCSTNY